MGRFAHWREWYRHPTVLGIPHITRVLGFNPTLTLTQIATAIWEGDAHITGDLGMGTSKTRGCPYSRTGLLCLDVPRDTRIENFQSVVFTPPPRNVTQALVAQNFLISTSRHNNIVLLPHTIHVSLSTGITFREDRWHYWLVLVVKSDVTWTDNHLIEFDLMLWNMNMDCETRIVNEADPRSLGRRYSSSSVISSSPHPRREQSRNRKYTVITKQQFQQKITFLSHLCPDLHTTEKMFIVDLDWFNF